MIAQEMKCFFVALIPFMSVAAPVAAGDRPVDTLDGGQIYKEQCRKCHGSSARIRRVIVRATGSEDSNVQAEWLTTFLNDHKTPKRESWSELIEYLLEE